MGESAPGMVSATAWPWWRKPFSLLWWRLNWTWLLSGRQLPDIEIVTIEVPDDSDIAKLMRGERDG